MADPSSVITNNQTTTQQGVQGSNQTQFNAYNPNQQSLQQNLGGMYQNFLSGQVPTAFTDPSALMAQYNQNFQNSLAPQLAAQYGAGSPQIGSQYNQGMVNLLGNQYNQGFSNYNNALNSGAGFAFNPIGQTQNTGTQFQKAERIPT